jgi:hypothetical protein
VRASNRWSEMFGGLLVCALCILGLAPMASAAQRFQMSLFHAENADAVPQDDSNYANLGWFRLGETSQPGGTRHSVLSIPHAKVKQWLALYEGKSESEWPSIDTTVRETIEGELSAANLDWSRIDALLIDEPYLDAAYVPNHPNPRANPCDNPSGELERFQQLQRMQRLLVNAAAVLRYPSLSPRTRFWVNFSEPELIWMKAENCPFRFSDWYIDVVSLDKYGVPFSVLEPYYDWLFANRPTTYQQLALVPQTFFVVGAQSDPADTVARRLQGFFDYAAAANKKCYLRIGRTGVTKSADGCPVWLVAGYWNDSDEVPLDHHFTTYWRPMFYRDPTCPYLYPECVDSDPTPIQDAWRAQYQLPRLSNLLGTTESFDIANGTISGWAVDRSLVDVVPCIDVWVDNRHYLGCTLPATNRPDVEAGTGIAMAGFTVKISEEQMKHLNDGGCHGIRVSAVARAPGVGTEEIGTTTYGYCR